MSPAKRGEGVSNHHLTPFGTTALPHLGDFAGSSQTLLSGCHSHKPRPNPYKCTMYPVGLMEMVLDVLGVNRCRHVC